MTSIVVTIARTSGNIIKFHHLKNLKLFHDFSLSFWNLDQILSILKETMGLLG